MITVNEEYVKLLVAQPEGGSGGPDGTRRNEHGWPLVIMLIILGRIMTIIIIILGRIMIIIIILYWAGMWKLSRVDFAIAVEYEELSWPLVQCELRSGPRISSVQCEVTKLLKCICRKYSKSIKTATVKKYDVAGKRSPNPKIQNPCFLLKILPQKQQSKTQTIQFFQR